ncbi:MAG TPA: DUF167 domain-containing protein [Phycisphaerales bacterium]|nr:DUF167 domain-containing protein [Phycisphaerales bacterium]
MSKAGSEIRVKIKAVPGASRDEIVGMLGERLKVRVKAPPEGGKANEAIRKLIAGALGIHVQGVTIEQGAASAEKTVAIRGITRSQYEQLFHKD